MFAYGFRTFFLAAAASGPLPALLVAAVDLAFLPVLAGWIAPPLIRERNRNTPLLAVLGALWAAAFAVFLVQYGPIL